MASEACVECGKQAPVGAVKCPHCGAEWPHRHRARRADAVLKRRRLVLAGALTALVLLVLVFVKGGGGPSQQCHDYDSARSRYDHALGGGADPTDPDVAQLHDEVERLRVACKGTG